ncbi:MAG: trigger factor [Chloroflexota bacterium]
MNVSTEQKENRQVELTVEVESEEMDKAMEDAFRRLANKVKVPGFRKGKVPRHIFEQQVGRDALVDEAIERLVPDLYRQAVQQEELSPVAQPQVEVTQREPLTFKALVPLAPKVELGNYEGVGLEASSAEVTEEDVNAALEEVRHQHAVQSPVERPVQLGDVVTIDVTANIEGTSFLDHKEINYEVTQGSRSPLPGFSEELVGLNKNETKDFSLVVPEDHYLEDWVGKPCDCHVTVKEVKQKELPALDDELARTAGYQDLASMRQQVASGLERKAKDNRDKELKQKALDAVVGRSTLEFPPVLEDKEIERMLSEQARRYGYDNVDDYLGRMNTSKDQVWEELRPTAKKRIANSLVLEKVAEERNIEINSSDVDNRVQQMIEEAGDKENAEKFLKLPQVRESIESSLRTDRTLEYLVKAVGGEALGTGDAETQGGHDGS